VRWSQTLIPTMKENPSDAEIPSHRLMIRAGLIRQLMAGAYTYLPLGWKSIRKAEAIIREEMDRAGAVELHMPALQPIELFERTGRREAFGNVLIDFPIRRGNQEGQYALGPTHEEVITDLVSKLVSSYRQLPFTMYQIQTKFRNEERPRFGVLRTSEFQMKDAYSFSATIEQLDVAYDAMYDAYCRIFARCGLEYLPVEAESGPIGGDASHEFMIPSGNGEDSIFRCPSCQYAANMERADTGRTANVAQVADGEMKTLEEVATPKAGTIEQVTQAMGCDATDLIKTLIYDVDGETVAVLMRGDHEANEGKIRRALDANSVELADNATIEKVTGAPVGFAGPKGLSIKMIADHDVPSVNPAVIGANKVDTHFKNVYLGRDYELPTDSDGKPITHDLRNAEPGDGCPKCDGKLECVHGIEVGHVFKLGTKYSEALDANFLDDKEQRHPIIMGCYGIGVNRIVAGIAETRHDDNGIDWPLSLAPFEVDIIPLKVDDEEVMQAAEGLYDSLKSQGVDVILDDRPARPGVKFKDSELIGFPLRVVIGGRGLAEGNMEVKWRSDEGPTMIPVAEVESRVLEMLDAKRAEEASQIPQV
jgi:prolyl-tRNA synthetase